LINKPVIKELFISILLFLLQPGFTQIKSDIQEPRGSTHDIKVKKDLIEVGVAPEYVPPAAREKQILYKTSHITAPLYMPTELDLYIPANKHFAVKFDHQSKSLDLIYPELENPFSSNIQAAIDKAPDWMENDLVLIFSQLSSQYQEKWAKAILDAEDPYIDEIAFSIAHLSPKYLMSTFAYTELIDLNAKLKDAIREGKKIKVTIEVQNLSEVFYGYGHKKLYLTNKHDLVFRKSNYICNRTVLINCTKSSNELSRKLLNALKYESRKIKISFEYTNG